MIKKGVIEKLITVINKNKHKNLDIDKSAIEKIKNKIFGDNTRIVKIFKAHGFECIIAVINGMWYTAYVGIPKDHPFYRKDYSYINEFVNAHGGITFSDDNVLGYSKNGIWWIGIDFAHAYDVCKGRHIKVGLPIIDNKRIVWDLKAVEKEIRNLAKQLKVDNLIIESI